MKIGNIYCVGRNYRMHALELGNDVPDSLMIFTKPTHAWKQLTQNEQCNLIKIPKDKGEVHFEVELVLRIGKGYVTGTGTGTGADTGAGTGIDLVKAIDSFTLGLDLTLRDVQSKLKAKGHPWLAAKGFKGSAVIGQWLPFTEHTAEQLNQGIDEFKLLRNGELAQLGCPKDMIFSVGQLIAFIDEHYGLGPGDLIYTGTPAGVAALNSGDQLSMLWNGEQLGSCTVD